MQSPGRPPGWRREHPQRFWAAVARGLSSEDAAAEAGLSQAVGSRWFREPGGMSSITQAPLSGRYLSFVEREEIALLHAQRLGVREIARLLGRSPSTISRELRRNAATRNGGFEHRGIAAQWHAGDLILGLDRSAIGTLMERSSRFTMLLHLPPPADRNRPSTKHGPPVSGHGAEAVRDAIASTITSLPEQMRRSLTWDQGGEIAQHAQPRIDIGLPIYFCDPQSPWWVFSVCVWCVWLCVCVWWFCSW